MLLQNAKSMFVRDRLDWNRPHLNWVQTVYYSTRRRQR